MSLQGDSTHCNIKMHAPGWRFRMLMRCVMHEAIPRTAHRRAHTRKSCAVKVTQPCDVNPTRVRQGLSEPLTFWSLLWLASLLRNVCCSNKLSLLLSTPLCSICRSCAQELRAPQRCPWDPVTDQYHYVTDSSG